MFYVVAFRFIKTISKQRIIMEKNITLRCQSCGSAQIDILESNIGKCNHCGSTMILPKQNEDIIALLNSARVYRENYNYDLAIKTYQFVLEKDANELSAYEGILLSEYGIEYVKDAYTGKFIPTCHRAHFSSITENSYYKILMQLANESQKKSIEIRAKEIDRLQNSISEQLRKEDSYDVFISYKATLPNGEKTEDSIIAREIYEELTKKNYKVFFAEKTLENKIGSEFEPIIFKALHTSKIFILVGTSKENVESPWIRNEWSRFIDRIKNNESKLSNTCFIPVFKDMNPYDMPKVNNQYIQGIDATKIGFSLSIADAVERICKPQEQKNVLETFNDIDNIVEFENIRKAKIKELKHNNWIDLQTNPNKKVKRFFYNFLLTLPFIFIITTLVFLCDFRSRIYTTHTFILLVISETFLLLSTLIISIIHYKKYILKKIFQIFIPFFFSLMFLSSFFMFVYYVPFSMSGHNAAYYYNLSWIVCNDNGILYTPYNIGDNTTIGYIQSYNWKAIQSYKKENTMLGGVCLVFPDEIDGYNIVYCKYDYIPDDVDSILIPKYATNIDITTEIVEYNTDRVITIYYQSEIPSVHCSNGLEYTLTKITNVVF